MNDTPQHTYQVLTKRAERLYEIHHLLNWTKNIWMGVSVEDERVIEQDRFLKGNKCLYKVSFLRTINWSITKHES